MQYLRKDQFGGVWPHKPDLLAYITQFKCANPWKELIAPRFVFAAAMERH
jgi:hypothetical protein